MSQQVSTGKLLKRESLKHIELPDDVLNKLNTNAKQFLIVYVPKDDGVRITIIPSKSLEVLKILVHLSEFSPATLKSIADIIYDLKISTIHTSGICFHASECCYEAYVEMGKREDLSLIREKFLRIPQCKAVDLEVMKINS
nr:hypothetical protein [Candidatus Sigynarchaeota archaeon]